jgi:hypothetical protein
LHIMRPSAFLSLSSLLFSLLQASRQLPSQHNQIPTSNPILF